MARKPRNKVRVDFRKNREARARRQNLTRELLDDDVAYEDQKASERLSGKGKTSRRRTVVGEETDDGHFVIEVENENDCLKGRVLSSIGLNSTVQGPDGREYEATVRRVVRTMARDGRNAVVTGDIVLFRPEGDEHQAVIERVEPRHSTLSRSSQRREHMIVTNVDQALIVVSADDPPLKPSLIDRFLISSEKGGVRSVICINKIDLVNQPDLQPIVGLYAQLGYEVVLASATDGIGGEQLRAVLKGKETVLSGQSGVGKSSLLNLIQPGLGLKTSSVSEDSGKGRHTTRRATLMPLEVGGWVADTPGIRQFGLWDVIPEEVEGFFIEFRPFVTRCRFPDCTHSHERDCAVKEAVESHLISPLRYASYLRILNGDMD